MMLDPTDPTPSASALRLAHDLHAFWCGCDTDSCHKLIPGTARSIASFADALVAEEREGCVQTIANVVGHGYTEDNWQTIVKLFAIEAIRARTNAPSEEK